MFMMLGMSNGVMGEAASSRNAGSKNLLIGRIRHEHLFCHAAHELNGLLVPGWSVGYALQGASSAVDALRESLKGST